MTATPREFHFWVDFETTGLNPWTDTVLEAAWCFTDSDLRMVTPLRQRFARVMAPPSSRFEAAGQRVGHPLDPLDEEDWHTPELIRPYVRDMHESSGLRRDWWDTHASKPRSIITHPRDFYRLVAEDMNEAGITADDKLVLSGAGVSHFDDGVLTEVFDGFYPRRPVAGQWHYRIFDTSVALWVAGGRAEVDNLLANADDDDTTLPSSLLACELGVNANIQHLIVLESALPRRWSFMRQAAKPHRAADDVMFSLTDARALRHLVTQR